MKVGLCVWRGGEEEGEGWGGEESREEAGRRVKRSDGWRRRGRMKEG